jgi:hypothetical protein
MKRPARRIQRPSTRRRKSGDGAHELPDFFWLARPESEEVGRDPLGLSAYLSKLSGVMLPDVTTATTYGPFYYLFAFWADPAGHHKECFFRQPAATRAMKRSGLRPERCYNRMEWALALLNRRDQLRPIGVNSVASRPLHDPLPSGSLTVQNALKRYGRRKRPLAMQLALAARKLNRNANVVQFFSSAISTARYDGKAAARLRRLLSLSRSPLNRDVYNGLSKRMTELGRLTQGSFLRPTVPPDVADSRLQADSLSDVAACLAYGWCERELGQMAMSLFHRLLQTGTIGKPVTSCALSTTERAKRRCLLENRNTLLSRKHCVRTLSDRSGGRPDILRLLTDCEQVAFTGTTFPSNDWIGRDGGWCRERRGEIESFLRNADDSHAVHGLCRDQARRIWDNRS